MVQTKRTKAKSKSAPSDQNKLFLLDGYFLSFSEYHIFMLRKISKIFRIQTCPGTKVAVGQKIALSIKIPGGKDSPGLIWKLI